MTPAGETLSHSTPASATVFQIKPNSENRILVSARTLASEIRLILPANSRFLSPGARGGCPYWCDPPWRLQAACWFSGPSLLNQRFHPGSCWMDFPHNPQLAQHQVRRLLWSQYKLSQICFPRGSWCPDGFLSLAAAHTSMLVSQGWGWFSPPTGDKLFPQQKLKRRAIWESERGNVSPWLPSLSLLDKEEKRIHCGGVKMGLRMDTWEINARI